jgi:hypothetical protein
MHLNRMMTRGIIDFKVALSGERSGAIICLSTARPGRVSFSTGKETGSGSQA